MDKRITSFLQWISLKDYKNKVNICRLKKCSYLMIFHRQLIY